MLKITKTGITFNCTVYRGFRVSCRRFQQLELSRGNKCLFANSTASHSHLIHFNYSTQNGEFTLYNNSEFRQRTVSFRFVHKKNQKMTIDRVIIRHSPLSFSAPSLYDSRTSPRISIRFNVDSIPFLSLLRLS